MHQFILKDPGLIAAAATDLDNRHAADEARQRFAESVGADGYKVLLSAQDRPNGTGCDVQAVTLLKFDPKSLDGFVAFGKCEDGAVLALPDPRTKLGVDLAKDMAELPGYTRQLATALGFAPKIENGKVNFGAVRIEEIGRDVVVCTNRDPVPGLDIESISEDQYNDMKAAAARASTLVRNSAPTYR